MTVGKIKNMQQELIDLKEERKEITQQMELDKVAHDKSYKEYYKIRGEKQDQIRELDKKISEIESVTRLIAMSYRDNIFTYNGETHIIKKERIESIRKYSTRINIEYKPIGTSRVNTITIETGTEEQTDKAYMNIRKILLGV